MLSKRAVYISLYCHSLALFSTGLSLKNQSIHPSIHYSVACGWVWLKKTFHQDSAHKALKGIRNQVDILSGFMKLIKYK